MSSCSTGSVAFDRGRNELPRGVGVADRGLLVDAEHQGEVQRVSSVGEGFLELAVHAQPIEGGVLAARKVSLSQ